MTTSTGAGFAPRHAEALVRRQAPEGTRTTEMSALLDAGHVRPGARVSFIAAVGDHDAGTLDAVAGSEFVDDRIRLEE